MKLLNYFAIVTSAILFYAVATLHRSRTGSQNYTLRRLQDGPKQHQAEPQHKDQSIISGDAAGLGEFPWYAKFEGRKLCGGSVIAGGQFVLTAAHCVDDGYTPSQVRVGSTSYSSGGTLYRVTKKFIHPDFTAGGSYDHDIALLKIATGRFLGFLWPCNCRVPASVALNTNASIPNSGTSSFSLTVMGFGATNSQNVPSSRLNKLTVKYISNQECSTNYGSFAQEIKLCADKDNAGVCAGDSGGMRYF